VSWLEAFVAGFIVAGVATPAGVSGAVLLLPVQVSLLGIPSPSVTPTNLLYNVISTPGGVLRYRRAGGLDASLAGRLVAGTVPGVVVGAVIRVYWIPGDQGFRLVVAAVLIPLGVLLLIRNRPPAEAPSLPERWLTPSAAAVGVAGGIYGVGGGSIIAPILLLTGYSAYRVAPAALVSTMAASVVGVISFALLSLGDPAASPTPDWATGIAAGAGGAVGAFAGAAAQPRVPEAALRRLLGLLVIVIGVRYAHLSLTG
jgi:uncharacterized membrane protein YfcA